MNNEELDKVNNIVEEAMKVPDRDEKKYPFPDKSLCEKAGAFQYKLNLVASSMDANLQALLLKLWVDIYQECQDGETNHEILDTLSSLKEYLKESNNILFKTDALPGI